MIGINNDYQGLKTIIFRTLDSTLAISETEDNFILKMRNNPLNHQIKMYFVKKKNVVLFLFYLLHYGSHQLCIILDYQKANSSN